MIAIRLPNTPIARPWPILPDSEQCRWIALLRHLTVPGVTVDLIPVPDITSGRCTRVWCHQPGVYRTRGQYGEVLCLGCATELVRAGGQPIGSLVTLEVLRSRPSARWDWRAVVSEAAEAAL